jgi:hypothetical protein
MAIGSSGSSTNSVDQICAVHEVLQRLPQLLFLVISVNPEPITHLFAPSSLERLSRAWRSSLTTNIDCHIEIPPPSYIFTFATAPPRTCGDHLWHADNALPKVSLIMIAQTRIHGCKEDCKEIHPISKSTMLPSSRLPTRRMDLQERPFANPLRVAVCTLKLRRTRRSQGILACLSRLQLTTPT